MHKALRRLLFLEHIIWQKQTSSTVKIFDQSKEHKAIFIQTLHSVWIISQHQRKKKKRDGSKRRRTNHTWREAQLESQYLGMAKTKQKLGHKIRGEILKSTARLDLRCLWLTQSRAPSDIYGNTPPLNTFFLCTSPPFLFFAARLQQHLLLH